MWELAEKEMDKKNPSLSAKTSQQSENESLARFFLKRRRSYGAMY